MNLMKTRQAGRLRYDDPQTIISNIRNNADASFQALGKIETLLGEL